MSDLTDAREREETVTKPLLALSFADGSYSVFPADTNAADVIAQRDGDDKGVTSVDDLTDVVRIKLQIVEFVDRKRGVMLKPAPTALAALQEELQWHESQDKALSKSGRKDSDCQFMRAQHRDRIEAIEAVLAVLPGATP